MEVRKLSTPWLVLGLGLVSVRVYLCGKFATNTFIYSLLSFRLNTRDQLNGTWGTPRGLVTPARGLSLTLR